MNRKLLNTYVCPLDNSPLALKSEGGEDSDKVKNGELISANGATYPIHNSIPDFIATDQLSIIEKETRKEYDEVAEEFYDNAVDWLFQSFYENEDSV